jgi:hypothetical protein
MQMMVASRLTDGRVVFMDSAHGWVESIDDGVLIDTDSPSADVLAAAERAVQAAVIVEPYLIEVAVDRGRRRPVQLREAIRAFGPSVRDSEPAFRG